MLSGLAQIPEKEAGFNPIPWRDGEIGANFRRAIQLSWPHHVLQFREITVE